MSAKGLSGKTSFIPEYVTIHRFSTKFKIRSCFFYEYKSRLHNPIILNFVPLVYF